MVSGFFTSPKDRSRIFSGEDMDILMDEKCNGSFGLSKKLKISSKALSSMRKEYLLRNRTAKARYEGHWALVFVSLKEFYIETEGLQLLDEDIERFRQARFQGVLALDNGFIHPGPASNVV